MQVRLRNVSTACKKTCHGEVETVDKSLVDPLMLKVDPIHSARTTKEEGGKPH